MPEPTELQGETQANQAHQASLAADIEQQEANLEEAESAYEESEAEAESQYEEAEAEIAAEAAALGAALGAQVGSDLANTGDNSGSGTANDPYNSLAASLLDALNAQGERDLGTEKADANDLNELTFWQALCKGFHDTITDQILPALESLWDDVSQVAQDTWNRLCEAAAATGKTIADFLSDLGSLIGLGTTDLWPEPSFDGSQVQFRDKEVTQRDQIFDPNRRDDSGLTNVERMKQGNAPIGEDGRPVEIHHIGQKNDGPLVEVT